MKKCSKCGEIKSLEEFNRDKYRPDGRTYDCKQCRRSAAIDYYHTKDGLVTRIYSDERAISKKTQRPSAVVHKKSTKTMVVLAVTISCDI